MEIYTQVELSEFKHTLKIVHDVCQTTTKVPEDMIQQVRNDNYVDNPDIKVSNINGDHPAQVKLIIDWF